MQQGIQLFFHTHYSNENFSISCSVVHVFAFIKLFYFL